MLCFVLAKRLGLLLRNLAGVMVVLLTMMELLPLELQLETGFHASLKVFLHGLPVGRLDGMAGTAVA